MSTVRNVILFCLSVLFVVAILQTGLNRAEKTECVQWMEIAEENSLFYMLDLQVEQCERLGFDVSNIPRR